VISNLVQLFRVFVSSAPDHTLVGAVVIFSTFGGEGVWESSWAEQLADCFLISRLPSALIQCCYKIKKRPLHTHTYMHMYMLWPWFIWWLIFYQH